MTGPLTPAQMLEALAEVQARGRHAAPDRRDAWQRARDDRREEIAEERAQHRRGDYMTERDLDDLARIRDRGHQ